MSDAVAELRLNRLEEDMREVKTTLARLEPLIVRIDERLTTALPHLATKAELAGEIGSLKTALADKPGKLWLTTAIGVLLAAYVAGLAAIAALPVIAKLLH